ncbi:extracellular solute-binding protein [Paenibacillus oryzisoli]|uniref:ABC transporter substrate-binding protein n=1 Tax=Paenibacillus oryzisoli TaxID=1850517 RepID=A0A198AHR2_9BACL|nr:extracellular solute-binding protein [Paenibacillus oryzisoli]OAS20488.1 hypothetical protein A8708_18120 [Paenibacillus oryzisoli]
MKNTKRVVAFVCMSTILATTACTSGTKEQATATSGAAVSQAPVTPVKIRVFETDNNYTVPTTIKDDPTFQYVMKKTNTNLDWVFLPHNDYANQLRIKFASGDIPDLVQDWGINTDLMSNDQILPLNDLIDKYGPNLKAQIPKFVWDGVTINGKIMAIPEGPSGNTPSGRVIFVRKDWMDKAGIKEIPKTPDEYLNMLRAFRDTDLNGNGKKDEIPFIARENFTWMENIFGMFGVNPYTYNEYNGEILPGYVHPNFKKAIAYIKTMMDEKLIDPEFLTMKRNVWEQKIQNNQVGSWNHVNENAWDWQNKLNQTQPNAGANVIAIPTPKAPGVENAGHHMLPYRHTFLITKKAKDPAAIVKMMDWMISEEGQKFVYFGLQGVTWKEDGGKISYDIEKDVADKTSPWRPSSFNLVGYNKNLLGVQVGDKAIEKLDEVYQIAQKEGIPNLLLGAPDFKSVKKFPDLAREGNMWMEAASQIIYNKKPLDYFDEFVKNWRAQGGNEIVKEYTDWYKANKK